MILKKIFHPENFDGDKVGYATNLKRIAGTIWTKSDVEKRDILYNKP